MNAGLPYVSPDGSHIAFVSDRDGADLFVISANGTGKVQLRHTPEYESPAGWTRDSKGNSLQADKHNPKENLRVVVLGKRQTEK